MSQEFKECPVKSRQEDAELSKLEKEVGSEINKPKAERIYLKPLYLIAAHLMRVKISEVLMGDVKFILKDAPRLMDVL